MITTSFRAQALSGRRLLRSQGGPVSYGYAGQVAVRTIQAIANDHWSAQDPSKDVGEEFTVAKVVAFLHREDVPQPSASPVAAKADRMIVDGVVYQVTAARPHHMSLWRLALIEPTQGADEWPTR